jgi:hypothetical protein
MAQRPTYRGGPGIAMAVPPDQFRGTVRSYRDVAGLGQLEAMHPSEAFRS